MAIGASRLFGVLILLLTNAVLARCMSQADFGISMVIVSSITICSTVARFGFDRLLMKHVARSLASMDHEGLLLGAKSLAIGVLISVSSVCVLLAFPVLMVAQPHVQQPVFVTALIIGSIAIAALLQCCCETLRGFGASSMASLCEPVRTSPIISTIVLLLTVVAADRLAVSTVLSAYLIGQIVAMIPALCVISRYLKQSRKISGGMRLANNQRKGFVSRTVLRSASYISMTELLASVVTLGDVSLAGIFLPDSELAFWIAASQISQLILLPATFINLPVLPRIASMISGPDLRPLERILCLSTNAALGVTLMPFMAILVASPLILTICYGPPFTAATSTLIILCLGKLVFVWTGACGWCLMLSNRESIVFVNRLFSAVLYVGMGSILAANWGVHGLAVAATLATILSSLWNWIAVRKSLGIWTNAAFIRRTQR